MAVQVQKYDLLKMESFDALQMFNDSFKEKLVYEITTYDEKTKQKKTKYELTFIGIKQLILEMSQRGQAMEIFESSVERKTIDGIPINDVWYASVHVRNKETKHESWGVSEAPVFPFQHIPELDENGKKQWINDNGKSKLKTKFKQAYDTFGRTASVSKAIRNAERQQLPEMAIQLFVEKAIAKNKGVVQRVEDIATPTEPVPEKFCICEGGPKTQLNGRCKDCKEYSKTWWEQSH